MIDGSGGGRGLPAKLTTRPSIPAAARPFPRVAGERARRSGEGSEGFGGDESVGGVPPRNAFCLKSPFSRNAGEAQ
jgi:hypothetical protein